MPAYHSKFNTNADANYESVGNMFILPIKTARSNALLVDPTKEDIIDEAINLFRANCLFRNFEMEGQADRVLIYLTLFISECLGKINKNMPKTNALRELNTLALSPFAIPGDPNFPLNAMYKAPGHRAETMRQYMQQLRQELVIRLVDRVFVDDKPSKWWMCFQKRKFMNLSL